MLARQEQIEVPLREAEGGVLRVGNTRVPLDTVIEAYFEGATPDEIVERYPSLTMPQVFHVLSYYFRHQEELDAYLRRRRTQAEEVRRENLARFPQTGLRERLLARRRAAST